MNGKALARVLALLLLTLPTTAGDGYRTDYDFPGMGDDWYGRAMQDTRRDFAATPLDVVSNGDDFDRGYQPLVARPGSAVPLARTDGPGSAYAFFNDPIAAGGPADCDNNGIDDACDLDCGAPAGPCDVPGCGTASDCNTDAIPDVCQLAGNDCDADGLPDDCALAAAGTSCSFPVSLLDNGTTDVDATFLGPPDDVYYGIGGQVVTWIVGCGYALDGPGPDITVYETDSGGEEFASMDLLASLDGVTFFSLKTSETAVVRIPGDNAVHVNNTFARSYDLAAGGLGAARYIRIDGNGSGASGASAGFDLDALGIIHAATFDCDASGVLDACEALADCDADGIPESCELALGSVADCDASGTADSCDTLGGANDCNGNRVPDVCEPDCNTNATPDDCDIAALTSADCNGNATPDECDLAATTAVIEPSSATVTTQIVFSEDFETPDTTNYITYTMGQSIVTASTTWLVTATGVDLYEAPARAEAAAYDGTQAVDLTGSPGAGVIETAIDTVPGQAYELVFHYARNNLLGSETGDAMVDVLGGGSLLQAAVRHDPATHPFDTYLEYRGVFVADAALAILRFTSLDPGNTGITLDGITVASLTLAGPSTFASSAPFAAAGDVTALVVANTDLGAVNEYLDLEVNAVPLARFFETDGLQCLESASVATIAAADFNFAVGGTSASIALTSPSTVNAFECAGSHSTVLLSYTPIVDCNANGTLDQCDIAGATSTDANLNGVADDCETDCNANLLPDDYDIAQGTSLDCNGNAIPDECDVASMAGNDCNANGIPDECEADCNSNGVADECDISSATSTDCDTNTVPDECDLVHGAAGCAFPALLLDNGTTGPDAGFVGPPDGVYYGLGGQVVTYEFDCGFVADGPGSDFTVYEVSTGGAEFNLLGDVLVSADGVAFFSVRASEAPVVRIPGDEAHTNDSFARSYDIAATGLNAVRFVRLDGAGTGSSGAGTGFDLDAIGAVNRAGLDCDASGVLDSCETFTDCNANALPDACEVASGLDDDCNANATLDACDILGGAADVDADWIPDSCEPDCNLNAVPDHYEIEQGASSDCNDNTVPDECDLSGGASQDCNADLIPDECPTCPPVEVVFIVDSSSSMDAEAAALCADITQIVNELQADLLNVSVELLGILATPGGSYACLTDNVGNAYGTAVPGTPPPGQEILGQPCGANLNEDWGPATAIVAGLKPWQADSVRLIVPISDEGPRCGDPVTDPGEDRDAVLHAIGQAQLNNVIVSPVSGTGSSQSVLNMMDLIAGATNGQTFSSTDPALDLAAGIKANIVGACDARGDCNANDVPDACDLAAMTSQDCDMSSVPDECEADCNMNGLHDSCDIANMTSNDTNTNAVPDECEGIVLTAGATDWTWTPVGGALGYDLIRGDLFSLPATMGDYGTVTHSCLANDHAGLAWPLGADPSPGQQFYYLVRGVLGSGPLSYDTFGAGLVAGRDGGIAASGTDCP